MGYFPNGSSAYDFQSAMCSRCVHDGACAVMEAHMLKNYDDCNNPNSILHILIPRNKRTGCSNGETCRMFFPGKSPTIEAEREMRRRAKTINPVQLEWARKKGLA